MLGNVNDDLEQHVALNTIGERYHEHRRQLMLTRQEGLTKTYNRFHNPTEQSADIADLRRLHVEMDQAVATVYGWTDLDLDHGFHQTKQGLRYTISEQARRTVLDRLLALNHERYAEEVRQGLHDKGAKKATGKGTRGMKTLAKLPSPDQTPQLVMDLGESQQANMPAEMANSDFSDAAKRRKRKAATPSILDINVSPQQVMATLPTSKMTPLDRSVIVLAQAIKQHYHHGYERTLGHVKAEKILHIIEAHGTVDLGRAPIRMAAGPADFAHLLDIAAHGKKLGVFQDIRKSADRRAYQFVPLPDLEQTANRMEEAFGHLAERIDYLIERFVGLNTHESEIVATLYAAWNDLLADEKEVDEDKLFEEFFAWDDSKRRFQIGELRRMKAWMEGWGIVPTGTAKRTLPRRNI